MLEKTGGIFMNRTLTNNLIKISALSFQARDRTVETTLSLLIAFVINRRSVLLIRPP